MPFVPSGNTSTSCSSSCSSRYALSGCAATPPLRDHNVPTTGMRAEEVLGEAVHRPAEILLDAVHDRRRVGRDRARVVRDEQRAARRRAGARSLPTRRGTSACRSGRTRAASARGSARCGPSGRRRSDARSGAGSGTGRDERDELAADAGIDLGEVDVGVGRGRDLQGSLGCALGSVGHRRSLCTGRPGHQPLIRPGNGGPCRTAGRT